MQMHLKHNKFVHYSFPSLRVLFPAAALILLITRPADAYIGPGAGFAVLSGVQMMMLGALGEYLARTFDEARQRPLFFIEKRGPEPR